MSRSNRGKDVDRTPHYHDEHCDEDEQDGDDWTTVTDRHKRRQIQNRLAQRKYRDKVKIEKEESERESRDRAAAGNAYSRPNPLDLEQTVDPSGVPWGSFSMRHMALQQRSRESPAQSTQPFSAAMSSISAGHTYSHPALHGGSERQDPSYHFQDPQHTTTSTSTSTSTARTTSQSDPAVTQAAGAYSWGNGRCPSGPGPARQDRDHHRYYR